MTVHILTDSSHYLEPDLIRELGLHILPLSLTIGGQPYEERTEITTSDLFELLQDRSLGWPTTSAITPGELQAAYDECTADPADEVVAVFLSRGTSVSVETAQSVAAGHPARDRIQVVDSLVISAPLALTLHTVGRLARDGATAAQIAGVARRMGEQMRVLFTVDTMEYLHRGGRVRGSQALIGNLLRIKPVLWMNQGQLEAWGKARGKRRAFEMMIAEAVNAMPAGEPVHAIVADAHAPEDKVSLVEALQDRLQVTHMFQAEIGPVVAAHTGPGCVTFAVVPESATRPLEG